MAAAGSRWQVPAIAINMILKRIFASCVSSWTGIGKLLIRPDEGSCRDNDIHKYPLPDMIC